MPNNRLLSDEEMIEATPYLTTNDVADGCHICSKRIAKAQDLKTAAAVNAEWVEWVEDIEKHLGGCEFAGDRRCITTDCSRDIFTQFCPWWQERKKEKGI